MFIMNHRQREISFVSGQHWYCNWTSQNWLITSPHLWLDVVLSLDSAVFQSEMRFQAQLLYFQLLEDQTCLKTVLASATAEVKTLQPRWILCGLTIRMFCHLHDLKELFSIFQNIFTLNIWTEGSCHIHTSDAVTQSYTVTSYCWLSSQFNNAHTHLECSTACLHKLFDILHFEHTHAQN